MPHLTWQLRAVVRRQLHLRKKIAEVEQQTTGIKAEQDAIVRHSKFTKDELAGLKSLSKDLVPIDRIGAVERRDARYDGQLSQLGAEAGQAGAEIAQAQLQIDEDIKSDVAKQLSEDESKLNEMAEHKIAAEDQLKKLEIRAPQDGTVYQLSVHAVGAVVGAGEPIMIIVPRNDMLVVETAHRAERRRPRPYRFRGRYPFHQPRLAHDAGVHRQGRDHLAGHCSRPAHWCRLLHRPRQRAAGSDAEKLGDKLVPGMPVEVMIPTGSRTVLSYLVRPLGDQLLHLSGSGDNPGESAAPF
jgi:HlyD family secretion protein